MISRLHLSSHRLGVTRRELGFSLVEVLVSIVVLSFGLLGMVGLQAASLQANRDARLQSSAIVMARELAEMMRGNKDVALAASSNPYLTGSLSSPLVAPTAQYCLSVGQSCANTTQVAQAQLTEWLARVDAELPGARISICRDTAPYDGAGMPKWGCTSASENDPVIVKIGWSRASTVSGSTTIERATVPSVVLPVTSGSTL